jgi:hypothetical protein
VDGTYFATTAGMSTSADAHYVERPGDLGGSDPWGDAESCPAQRKYPEELREPAVRKVVERSRAAR